MNLALLILRLTVGTLLAGHGAQKLFGWFGGYGLEGTSGWLGSLGFQPPKGWALMAGLSEFGGGVLTILGALNPLGPIAGMGAMLMATFKVHGGKPIWVTEGGAELPVTNMAVQTALIVAGPGALSVDKLLGIRVPRRLTVLGIAAVGATVYFGLQASAQPTGAVEEEAREALQSQSGPAGAAEIEQRPSGTHAEPVAIPVEVTQPTA